MTSELVSFHPAGEQILPVRDISLDTYSGKVSVEWDQDAELTPFGQLAFFIEFLKLGGLFKPWVEDCPLSYDSNNAPSAVDILGTVLLSVLSGHKRYAHMGALRNDTVNSQLLGMKQFMSSDSVRRGLKKIDEQDGILWLQNHLKNSYIPLLQTPWVLDIDATVKCIYGHQEGAHIGYNPKKPGRPSHVYHTYLIANIRLVLGVEVLAGDQSHASHSLNGLLDLLTTLPLNHRPKFVRGDCDYGNEGYMLSLEKIEQPYLFKLRKSANTKRLIMQEHGRGDWTFFDSKWESKSCELQLTGWSKKRRVILVRKRVVKKQIMLGVECQHDAQQSFSFVDEADDIKVYEYSVIITSMLNENSEMIQHYRDRGDAENVFDELKNQWGWSGFTTHDLKRCRLIAGIIALSYNWWTLFVRCCEPHKHTEAVTSRPKLLSSIGRLTKSSRQRKLSITNTHTECSKIREKFISLGKFFEQLRPFAQQLTKEEIWKAILVRAMQHFKLVGFSPPVKLNFLYS